MISASVSCGRARPVAREAMAGREKSAMTAKNAPDGWAREYIISMPTTIIIK